MELWCRLCLQDAKEFRSVLDFRGNMQMKEIIEKICTISLQSEEGEHICSECWRILSESYELRETAIRNDEYLREERMRKDAAATVNENDFIVYEEIIHYEPDAAERDELAGTEEYLDESIELEQYSCDYCNIAVPTKQDILDHLLSSHISCPKLARKKRAHFECDECQTTFTTAKRLEMHRSTHSHFIISELDDGQKLFECRFCGRVLSDESRVREHIYYHRNYKDSLPRSPPHNRERHAGGMQNICPHCGTGYKTKQILMQHMKRHTEPEGRFQCEKCPLKFKTWSELYYHLSVHTTERNFKCHIKQCGKAFKAKRLLRNHLKRHETEGVKDFECSRCGLRVKSKFSLERHMLTHDGIKSHCCPHCSKSFVQKTELNKHLRIHVGENTYCCQTCDQSFRLLAELRLHEEIHFIHE